MGGRRLLFEKALDVLFGRLVEQRLRAAPAAILEDAHPSFTPSETLDARIDGGSGAVEGPGDLSGREAIGGKQRYVHPQPTTGFRLALHLADKVLALLGGEDDTLHGRSSLWWLDGFGVFTMPQGTAVCSIILCIYLDPPLQHLLALGVVAPKRMYHSFPTMKRTVHSSSVGAATASSSAHRIGGSATVRSRDQRPPLRRRGSTVSKRYATLWLRLIVCGCSKSCARRARRTLEGERKCLHRPQARGDEGGMV